MNEHRSRNLIIASVLVVVHLLPGGFSVFAQTSAADTDKRIAVISASLAVPPILSLAKYFDPQTGITVDQAVAYALEHNGELQAARKEIDAASAFVKQAALRANPKVDASVSKTVTSTDNNIPVNGMLPLELGGRHSARLKVAY